MGENISSDTYQQHGMANKQRSQIGGIRWHVPNKAPATKGEIDVNFLHSMRNIRNMPTHIAISTHVDALLVDMVWFLVGYFEPRKSGNNCRHEYSKWMSTLFSMHQFLSSKSSQSIHPAFCTESFSSPRLMWTEINKVIRVRFKRNKMRVLVSKLCVQKGTNTRDERNDLHFNLLQKHLFRNVVNENCEHRAILS